MHTVETDGKCTIEKWRWPRGSRLQYMAITDHSKNLHSPTGWMTSVLKLILNASVKWERPSKGSGYLPASKWIFLPMANLSIRLCAGADGIARASIHSDFNQDTHRSRTGYPA